jgi:hypothetical protein
MPDVDLPYGDKFTPGALPTPDGYTTELVAILDTIAEASSADELEDAITDRFDTSDSLARNCRRSIANYGLIQSSQNPTLTELGSELYDLRDDPDLLYERFAEHVLLNLHGLTVLQVIGDLQAEGEDTTTPSVNRAVNNRTGIYAGTPDANHWDYMRQWLERANIISGRGNSYSIDWATVEELTGAPEEELEALQSLSHVQRTFLLTLARLNPSDPVDAADVRTLAEAVFEIQFPYKRFADEVLHSLDNQDFVEYEQSGRGAGTVAPSDRQETEVIVPLIDIISRRKDIPRDILRTPYNAIFDDLDADDYNTRGDALEKLAIKIGRLLDLEFRGWQTRAAETGHSEVDVVFDSTTTTFDRWQIQCKNPEDRTAVGVSPQTVAREAGIARRLQSNVLLLITTGRVSDNARAFARQVMVTTNLSIHFLSGNQLEEFDGDPTVLVEELERQAREMRQIRALGTEDLSEPYGRADIDFADRSEELESLIESVLDDE